MSSSRHDHAELGPPELIEVGDGVFAYVQPDGSWYINNTGFVAGRSSVISVDACSTERRTRAYLDRIGSVTAAPVTVLVNTHHHGDHTYGNSLFGPATIVGRLRPPAADRCRRHPGPARRRHAGRRMNRPCPRGSAPVRARAGAAGAG